MIDKLIILAIGASIATGFGTLYDDDIPPPRFQRLGTLPVTFAKQDEINRLCGTPPAGQNLETKACSLVGKPHIVLADPVTSNTKSTAAAPATNWRTLWVAGRTRTRSRFVTSHVIFT
jgi:hypothetical protein